MTCEEINTETTDSVPEVADIPGDDTRITVEKAGEILVACNVAVESGTLRIHGDLVLFQPAETGDAAIEAMFDAFDEQYMGPFIADDDPLTIAVYVDEMLSWLRESDRASSEAVDRVADITGIHPDALYLGHGNPPPPPCRLSVSFDADTRQLVLYRHGTTRHPEQCRIDCAGKESELAAFWAVVLEQLQESGGQYLWDAAAGNGTRSVSEVWDRLALFVGTLETDVAVDETQEIEP